MKSNSFLIYLLFIFMKKNSYFFFNPCAIGTLYMH